MICVSCGDPSDTARCGSCWDKLAGEALSKTHPDADNSNNGKDSE